MTDTFCANNSQPNVSLGLFLATWAVQHVIDTNPGGVAGPIKVAVFPKSGTGQAGARMLPDDEISEHHQAIEGAAKALRLWRDELQSGKAAENAPGLPDPPNAP